MPAIPQPTKEELTALVGPALYEVWTHICERIEARYETDRLWSTGGKRWTYEYKYRRGGKTLCAMYAKAGCVGFMVIFGEKEREQFEQRRQTFSAACQREYDAATTYRDGKWFMLCPTDDSMLADVEKLLLIKRRPNRTCE